MLVTIRDRLGVQPRFQLFATLMGMIDPAHDNAVLCPDFAYYDPERSATMVKIVGWYFTSNHEVSKVLLAKEPLVDLETLINAVNSAFPDMSSSEYDEVKARVDHMFGSLRKQEVKLSKEHKSWIDADLALLTVLKGTLLANEALEYNEQKTEAKKVIAHFVRQRKKYRQAARDWLAFFSASAADTTRFVLDGNGFDTHTGQFLYAGFKRLTEDGCGKVLPAVHALYLFNTWVSHCAFSATY